MPPSTMTQGPQSRLGDNFPVKRGHTTQLSISDPSHHVTEAIGTLYGDEDDSAQETGRPLSYINDGYQEQIGAPSSNFGSHSNTSRQPPKRSATDYSNAAQTPYNDQSLRKSPALQLPNSMHRSSSLEQGQRGQLPSVPSSSVSLRDVQADASGSQFPLTNIVNPNDIAQELSNLQALRRLSMDVGNRADPDMPMTLSSIPSIAPTGNDDEGDPSRLLWVPARVHPELAPSEFKSFLENRVNSIRRRSGDSHLSVDGDRDNGESSSLRRRKSMLSHQIDNSSGSGAEGYLDGAERLERQRSRRGNLTHELSLEELVNDPAGVVQRLSQETQAQYADSLNNRDDMPILPMAPGMGLRRSTRTTYRKGGSLRNSNRAANSRRIAGHQQESASLPMVSPPLPDAPRGHGLERVKSEPNHENFSRPNRAVRRQNKFSQEPHSTLAALQDTAPSANFSNDPEEPGAKQTTSARDPASPPTISITEQPTTPPTSPTYDAKSVDTNSVDSFPQRSSSQGDASRDDPQLDTTKEEVLSRSSRDAGVKDGNKLSAAQQQQQKPRSQSQQHQTQHQQQQPHHPKTQQTTQHTHPQYTAKSPPPTPQSQTLSEGLASNPSLPGGGNTRTDALTFIPTLGPDERKSEKKSKKDKDDDGSSFKSSGAWKWLKGVTDDKKKDENKKSKAKASALAEKVQDSARLDVLQTSIDKTVPKGRESLVLDRDSFEIKLQEERKKESLRKAELKKEKDGNIFSSIFGTGKKKEEKEKEKSTKKHSLLHVPDEPIYKPLQPDVDYNWTRFPLLEERAIYRMAHIKLANPRRPLLSQVLLSNFMYSYLAIVQAMHPQMNIPISPQQKRLEEEARRKQQEQEYLAQQGTGEGDQQDMDQYNFDYHRSTIQYAESGNDGSVDYVDDSQIYEDDHGDSQDQDYDYGESKSYDKGEKDYYEYRES
ncbi:telomere silencing protein Zds1 [Cordyceps militaris CM01]|uniref:Telomere silencing protein Zds1 n=1 Tax=Cordyceps militaris (strain CM01) TaxID=983644 RepID=G3J3N5_CORMM|nr:telomere silencing protein Zds1 [Cordyceps militaris CM01]EGX95711.1 telomere silencing protein Zds1 [Cordyceps militaris CM01]